MKRELTPENIQELKENQIFVFGSNMNGNHAGGAASATGNYGAASATGNYGAASATGDYGAASATGNYGAASATGDYSAASATGNYGAASATGDYSAASATGKDSIALAAGYGCKAKGAIGCWIVLAERGEWNGDTYPIKEVKADTWYMLVNGQLKEVWRK